MQHQHQTDDGDKMSGIPIGIGLLCYSLVAMALHIETGSAHAGLSWPMFAAFCGVVAGFIIDRRHIHTE